MKVSYRWLSRHLPQLPPPEEVAATLVRLGLEVVSLQRFGESFRQVELVELLERRPHPRSPRLWLAVLARGNGERVTVVTGAPEVAPGTRLWWAPPGTALADGRILQVATIHGEASPGMLVSHAELGFVGPDDGLWRWEGREPLGTRLAEVVGEDTVLELELTPNLASYAQSIYGVARELGAALGVAPLPVGEGWDFGQDPLAEVADAGGAPVYSALLVEGSGTQPSPLWMQALLLAVGQRPLRLAVDATNFLLYELGQPVHAFDAERLALPLVVRRAKPGERLTTLDGVERRLDPEDLVIADQEGPVALAGIMGGASSAVGPGTRRILLESAHFDASTVFRAMRRHGLTTEAGLRFGKGSDWQMVGVASRRWVELLRAEGPLEVTASQRVGEGRPLRQVPWRPERIRQLLGVDWDDATVWAKLERLGFRRLEHAVVVPSWRVDVEGLPDLAEEVARVTGLDQIPERMPKLPMAVGERLARETERDRVRRLLTEAGFWEVITRSFTSPEREDGLVLAELAPVQIENPLREEERQLRRGLLPGLLEVLAYNRGRSDLSLPVFEVGPAFCLVEGTAQEWDEVALAWVLEGESRWPSAEEPTVYHLKGAVAYLIQAMGWQVEESQADIPAFLHPGRALTFHRAGDGAPVGFLGELHPRVASRYQLRRVAVGALRLDLPQAPEAAAKRRPSRFPEVVRDLSLLVPEGGQWRQVSSLIEASGVPHLVQAWPIDRYQGEFGLSLTVRLIFQSDLGTLTDEAVDAELHQIVANLEASGYRLREKM